MSDVPAPIAVDKEQVRMLVMEYGVREAARKLELNENTVLDWAAKGKWLAATKPTPASMPLPASMVPTISPIKPADAMANTLKDCHVRTKAGLASWSVEASEHAAKLKGEEALAAGQSVVSVATVMTKLWPEQQQPAIRLNLYGQMSSVEHEIIDVEQATVQELPDSE